MSAKKSDVQNEIITGTDSNAADYAAMSKEIAAIPVEELETVTIPVEVLISESESLYFTAKKHEEDLTGAGLEAGAIDMLQPAAGALRFCAAELIKVQDNRGEWLEESPAAFELRDSIRHHFIYAFRNDPSKLRQVHSITEGATNADMVQHLQNLSTFGHANEEELKAIGFDMALLDTAAGMSARMGNLLGQNNAYRNAVSEVRITRDRAYTCLKRLVGRIRECGQYVYYRDESRRKYYVSNYYRRNRKKTDTYSAETAAQEVRVAA